MSFDNYSNQDPANIPDMFCENCGAKIDEPQIAGEGTEYEHEVKLCEDCFWEEIGKAEVSIA